MQRLPNYSNAPEDVSLSFEVIAAVAERENVDPVELEPSKYEALYDVVDPEALDSLFVPRHDDTDRTSGRVEFSFCGYDVVVTGDGTVALSERADTQQ